MNRFRQMLSRRRKGAVAMVAVVGMIPAATILAANINSGQMTNDRRVAQDAADALAMMHGQWTARALNMISMNQVAATQAMTVAIGSEALDGTLQELQLTAAGALGYIGGHAAANCPPRSGFPANIVEAVIWSTPCFLQHGYESIQAIESLIEARRINNEFDPEHGIEVSHLALEAIEGMNRALFERHPRAMREIAQDYAQELGIDTWHFADPCVDAPGATCDQTNSRDGMALPIEDGELAGRIQFCLAMNIGTTSQFTTFATRGFPMGRGPMQFGGSDGTPVVKDHINEESEIGEALEDFYDWYDDAQLLAYIYRLDDYPQTPPFQLVPGQDADGPNSFTRRFDAKELSACTIGESITGPLNDLIAMEIEAPMPTMWILRGMSTVDVMPPVRPEEMSGAFHILAYAQIESDERVGTRVLGQAMEELTAWGQVGVYNPDGADLFSQNWHSILMPATRADDPRDAGDRLDRQATADFDQLARTLQQVTDLATWGRVNAH
jgi:hypothetical protein